MSTYVVEEAELTCTLGSRNSFLELPDPHLVILKGKQKATINDHRGNKNIMTFGKCARAIPEPGCSPSIPNKWQKGKEDIFVEGDGALKSDSFCICSYGGTITIVDDGQE